MVTSGDATVGHYECLGVDRDASPAAVRAAYRAAIRRSHPDLVGPGGEERTAAINAAWYVLRDPVRRRAYDGSPTYHRGSAVSARGFDEHTPPEATDWTGHCVQGAQRGFGLQRLVATVTVFSAAVSIVFLILAMSQGH